MLSKLQRLLIAKKILGLAVFLICLGQLHTAAAATPTTEPPSMTVTPALLTAQVGSKQTQTSVSVGVRNGYDTPITISATLNGFDVRNNALVPMDKAEAALGNVITIDPAQIEIPAHSSKNVLVRIKDDTSLSPGAHYVSLLITQTNVSNSKTAAQLSLKTAVSATIYVIKEDGAVRSLSATKVQANHTIFSLPKTADITFKNTGNVMVVPRGVVRLGKGISSANPATVSGQGVINESSAPLFPASQITLQAPIKGLKHIRTMGRVTLQADYRADGQAAAQQTSLTFWYIPKMYVLIMLFLVLLAGALINRTTRNRLLGWCANKRRGALQPYEAPNTVRITAKKQDMSERKKPVLPRKRL